MSGTNTSVTLPGIPTSPIADPQTGMVNTSWLLLFQALRDDMAFGGGGNAVLMQTGTSSSDSSAVIDVTLPQPYSVRTLSFSVDGSPDQPAAFFSQGPADVMTKTKVTGKLQMVDISTGGTVDVPNTNFAWYATGV